jgi:hypothetical protein
MNTTALEMSLTCGKLELTGGVKPQAPQRTLGAWGAERMKTDVTLKDLTIAQLGSMAHDLGLTLAQLIESAVEAAVEAS